MALQFEINAVTPFRQNCTLIWDDETKEAVLTDVGGDVPYLLQQIQNKGLKLTAIWLTHGHLDHAGGVVELLKTCDVPVLGPHKDDEFLLQALPQTTAQYGFPRFSVIHADALAGRRGNAQGRQPQFPSPPHSRPHPRPSRFLQRRKRAFSRRRCFVL